MPARAPIVIGVIALGGLALLTLGGLSLALVSSVGGPPSPLALALAAHHRISVELAQGIESTARAVGTRPEWLAAVMSLETNGTFSPSIRNPVSKAVGLIQFTNTTAGRLGTTTNKLAELSAVGQLPWVQRYLETVSRGAWPDDPRPVALDTLQRLAFSVFWLPGRTVPLSTSLPDHLRAGNPFDEIGEYLGFIRSRMLQGVS